jgi:hypothetical protein
MIFDADCSSAAGALLAGDAKAASIAVNPSPEPEPCGVVPVVGFAGACGVCDSSPMLRKS